MSGCTNRFAQLAGLLVIFVVGAFAGPPPLTITDSGYWITTVDESGYPTLVKIETVNDLRRGADVPTDSPKDPSPPKKPDPPADGISQDAYQWALAAKDPEGAQKYALIFEAVRDGVKTEDVTTKTLFRVLRQSADAFVDDRWDAFRRKISDHLTEELTVGNLQSKESLINKLELIRYGVGYSAIGSKPISMQESVAILDKVNGVIGGSK